MSSRGDFDPSTGDAVQDPIRHHLSMRNVLRVALTSIAIAAAAPAIAEADASRATRYDQAETAQVRGGLAYETVYATINSEESKGGSPIPTPAGEIDISLSCNHRTFNTMYNGRNQRLGRCLVGASATVSEALPAYDPGGDNSTQWFAYGSTTQRLKVGKGPKHVKFKNDGATLDGQGTPLNGTNYYWVTGRYMETAEGAEADIPAEAPKIPESESPSHSIGELYVGTTDQQDAVEIGWIVDPAQPDPSRPHLFVNDWINGSGDCYDTCGFVSTGTSAGSVLPVGQTEDMQLSYSTADGGEWVASDNGQEVGYFPASLWNGAFTEAGEELAYGEVTSTSSDYPCEQMGDGRYADQPGAASISSFNVIDGTPNPTYANSDQLSLVPSAGGWYSGVQTSPNSFTYGGPGACR